MPKRVSSNETRLKESEFNDIRNKLVKVTNSGSLKLEGILKDLGSYNLACARIHGRVYPQVVNDLMSLPMDEENIFENKCTAAADDALAQINTEITHASNRNWFTRLFRKLNIAYKPCSKEHLLVTGQLATINNEIKRAFGDVSVESRIVQWGNIIENGTAEHCRSAICQDSNPVSTLVSYALADLEFSTVLTFSKIKADSEGIINTEIGIFNGISFERGYRKLDVDVVHSDKMVALIALVEKYNTRLQRANKICTDTVNVKRHNERHGKVVVLNNTIPQTMRNLYSELLTAGHSIDKAIREY